MTQNFPTSTPRIKAENWAYSLTATYCKIVKKLGHSEILSLKVVEANLDDDLILKVISDAIRDKSPRGQRRQEQIWGATTVDFSWSSL